MYHSFRAMHHWSCRPGAIGEIADVSRAKKKRVDFPPWPLDKCQRCGELVYIYIYMYMHVWVIRAPTRWLHCRRFAQSDTQVINCTKPIDMLAEFISRISTLVVGFISCRTSMTLRNQHVWIGDPCLPKRLVWRDMELSLHAKLRAPF